MPAELPPYRSLEQELPDDLYSKLWDIAVEDALHDHQPRDLSLEEEHGDVISTLEQHTGRNVLEIESHWPRICQEYVIIRQSTSQ